MAAIVDSSDDAIVAKDLDGMIQTWNQGAQRIFGYTESEAVGQHISLIIPPDLIDEERRIISEIRAGRRVSHFETVRRRKDGTLINVSLTVSPVMDPRGNIVGASKIARDITEQVRARKALRDMNAILEQRVEERTRELRQAVADLESFSGAASHDLRTPLRAITGLVQLVAADKGLSESHRRKLQLVLDSSKEMTRTTEALLRLSRIQRAGIRREPVDLSAQVKHVFDRLTRENPKRTADLEVEPGLTTSADPAMAAVVLDNLIGNAWKFSQKRPETRIRVGAGSREGRKMFFVEDNGVGITAPEAAGLFKPFQRLRPTEFEGVGIGLATVQRVINAHEGNVEAEPGPTGGARIWFDFGNRS